MKWHGASGERELTVRELLIVVHVEILINLIVHSVCQNIIVGAEVPT